MKTAGKLLLIGLAFACGVIAASVILTAVLEIGGAVYCNLRPEHFRCITWKTGG